MAQYSVSEVTGNAIATDAPSIPEAGKNPAAEQVTPQPPPAENVISKEEKVEFRDQVGNLLNEDQVSALEGKVSFNTRYETRTRILDTHGNQLEEGMIANEGGIAPPHPDVDRQPETVKDPVADEEEGKREYPATASPEEDISKEKSVEGKEKKAKPASEGGKKTKDIKDEL